MATTRHFGLTVNIAQISEKEFLARFAIRLDKISSTGANAVLSTTGSRGLTIDAIHTIGIAIITIIVQCAVFA